jgi:hypothetical protein
VNGECSRPQPADAGGCREAHLDAGAALEFTYKHCSNPILALLSADLRPVCVGKRSRIQLKRLPARLGPCNDAAWCVT